MIDSIGTALKGLQRAEEALNETARKISEGDVSADTLVQAKLDEHNVKVQAKNLAIQSKLEDSVLDILA